MITLVKNKASRFLNVGVGLGSALAILTLSSVAVAQTVQDSDARAAELMCELSGICGDLAISEDARVKETQDGKSVRAMMSIGAVKSALPVRSTNDSTSSRQGVVREPLPTPDMRVNGIKGRTSTPVLSASVTTSAAYVSPSVQQIAPPGRAKLMINFALGSDNLTDDSMFEVRSFALAVKNLDDQGFVKSFRIEGHADSSGSEAINLPLSARRAAAVRNMLVEAGVDTSRIDFVGYGSQRPLNGLSSSDSLNRRVEAVLVE